MKHRLLRQRLLTDLVLLQRLIVQYLHRRDLRQQILILGATIRVAVLKSSLLTRNSAGRMYGSVLCSYITWVYIMCSYTTLLMQTLWKGDETK